MKKHVRIAALCATISIALFGPSACTGDTTLTASDEQSVVINEAPAPGTIGWTVTNQDGEVTNVSMTLSETQSAVAQLQASAAENRETFCTADGLESTGAELGYRVARGDHNLIIDAAQGVSGFESIASMRKLEDIDTVADNC